MKADDELLRSLEGMPKPGTLWRHYAGNLYRVTGCAIQEAALEPLVLYQRVSGTTSAPVPVWARPLREWRDIVRVERDGHADLVPRFRQETTP